MNLHSIAVYPVKSMGGLEVDSAEVLKSGLLWDRRYLLVYPDGRFITQRENHKLTHIATQIEHNQLVLFEKRRPQNRIILDEGVVSTDRIEVRIWKHQFSSTLLRKNVSDWIENIIGEKCRLAKMDDLPNRVKTFTVPPYKTKLNFSDGYPFMLMATTTLDKINEGLETKVPMKRFRPNLVAETSKPFEEDEWGDFEIGTAKFRMVKKCARCIIITTNQENGKRDDEVMRSLSTYRKFGRNICVGMYAVCIKEGVVTKGDEIRFK